MKKYLLSLLSLLLVFTSLQGQKKYQSLMWEITGNGLSKPSYLYGTMHVSSKLAFHLGDSFFVALNNTDMVALEVNPETWVDDMLAYDPYAFWGSNMFYSNEKSDDKEKKWKSAVSDALSRDPSLINYYLYRSQGYTGNFEENTYLDLYIFQAGKKLKKRVGGLEKMAESMLMGEEAERAREEEYKYKKRNYNYRYDEDYQSFEDLLEDAYRRGDLDMIDSLNIADGTPGYLEYMLYRRNQNMADCMDSIMRVQKLSLFAGMGASHLPGTRGVIEMLRLKGYTLRPVTRGERDPKQKRKIDDIVILNKFNTQQSFDKYFEVDLPGKMYELTGFGPSRSYFHPDMANGAYYTVTRIKTFNQDLNYAPGYVMRAIDSMLYENIPGEIQKKKSIERNGFKGLSITTKVSKGDIHKYEIIITPDEIFVFKLGGHADFAKEKEADKFFNSIKLNIPNKTEWREFSTPDGTFSLQMPHLPLFYGDTSLMGVYFNFDPFTAVDFKNGNQYSVTKSYLYTGGSLTTSDSLLLENQIFEFADKKYYDQLERTTSQEGDMMVTDARYRVDENYHMQVRYIMRKGYLFTLSVKYTTDSADADRFVRSIKFATQLPVPFEQYKDTLMHFSVTTTPQKDAMEKLIRKFARFKAKDKPYRTLRESKAFLESPKADEAVTVTYIRYGKYVRFKDSATYWKDIEKAYNNDSSRIIISKKHYKKNGFDVFEIDYTDTGCTYASKEVNMQRNAVLYELRTAYDQKKGLSAFSSKFLETFTPNDTIIGEYLFGNNAELIMADLNSPDSATRAEAREYMRNVKVKPEHFSKWKMVIDTLQPGNEKYFDYKSGLIEELWEIKTPENITYLKDLYEKAGDTITFQLSVLKTLLYMETAESYKAFKSLLMNETPLGNQYELNSLFWSVDDSLELAATLYPELFKLFSLEEYKEKVVRLLATLIDSSKVNQEVYKDFLPTLISDAKNEVKRQTASEVEEEESTNDYNPYMRYGGYNTYGGGNSYLGNLATILITQYDDKNVKALFDKMLQMKNNQLRIQVAVKLLKNKRAVPDTLWESIAKTPSWRISLYEALEKQNRTDVFPAKYKTQDSMTQALVLGSIGGSYSKTDTIVLLQKRLVAFEGEKGYVYLYKYRYKDDEKWRLALVGLQPEDTAKINTSTRFFNARNSQKLDEKIAIDKQFDVMIKEEMLSLALGYGNYSYEDSYDEYDEGYYDEEAEY